MRRRPGRRFGGGGRRAFGVDVRFWSAHSWAWDDRLADAAIAARIEELATWLVDALAGAGGSAGASAPRVVDIGCGTGNHSAALIRRGADVVGVDFAPGMLGRAVAKSEAAGESLFVRADLRDGVPLRAGSLDGALSVYSAQFFDLATYAADVARVLRPGGALVLELPRPGVRRKVRRGLSWRHRVFQRVNVDASVMGQRIGLVHVVPSIEVDRALAAAGFTVVGHRDSDRSTAVLATLSR